jgi:hypothetical protein
MQEVKRTRNKKKSTTAKGFKKDNGQGKNKHLVTRKHRNNNPSFSKRKNEAKKTDKETSMHKHNKEQNS